jgi:TRAP-type C4-dicarboxylate transport system permease small subunit
MVSFAFAFGASILVIGINYWDQANTQNSLDWTPIATVLALLFFSGFLYAFIRMIYKFVLAKARHDEQQP